MKINIMGIPVSQYVLTKKLREIQLIHDYNTYLHLSDKGKVQSH